MPTYNIAHHKDNLSFDLSKSIKDKKDKSIEVENDEKKVSIPLKQFQELLKMMESVSISLANKKNTDITASDKYKYSSHVCFCDGCKTKKHIKGVRYQCLVCQDFDLCETCYVTLAQNPNPNAFITHSMNNFVKHYDYHAIARIPLETPTTTEKIKTLKESSKQSSLTNTNDNVLEFDINAGNEELFTFFKKFTDDGHSLQDLKEKWDKYDSLLINYENLLKEVNREQENKKMEITEPKENDYNGISVSFNIEDKNCILFKVINNSKDYVIPKNSNLHFNFGQSKDNLTKCYLKMSDKESIQPGSLQMVRFNHMFNDYDILKHADYFEIKILNSNNKILFESISTSKNAREVEKNNTDKNHAVAVENKLVISTPALSSDVSETLDESLIDDEGYDILSELDDFEEDY